MTEEKETKSGRRKKWMLVAGTILVIAAVFTCISWNSMHPSKTVTMKELEDYASQELINQIECINGSYVVMICDEQEPGQATGMPLQMKPTRQKWSAGGKSGCTDQKPEDFSACDFHYVCYTVCNLLWDCVGNLETLREIPDWKEKTALPGVRKNLVFIVMKNRK